MARNCAFILVLIVAILVAIGMVMLFSAGAYSHDNHGDMYYFLKRQAIWLVIGMVACTAAAIMDYHYWEKLRWPLFIGAMILLALCFVPHVGLRLNGSPRWIRLAGFVFQPSELAKFSAAVALAWWLCKFEKESSQLWRGFVFPLALMGVLMLLIVAEQDLGTTVLIGTTSLAVMFIAGCNAFYIGLMGIGGVSGILMLAMKMPERMARLTAFMDLEKHKEGSGLQQWVALQAFGSGGIHGVGLGGSIAKMQYLPYAHTEFIFPIIGEELGLPMTLFIVLAFLVATMCGIIIALQARDRFGMLLGFGLSMSVALQASVNIGMTTALLPNKGMSLPFISSGGSNLCMCLLFVGILLNIYRQGQPAEEGPVVSAAKLQARTTPRI